MILQLVNLLAAIGSLVGIILLAHKRKTGFIVFFGVEVCMFYIGLISSQYGVLAMSIIYFFSNIYAYCQWSREK